MASRKATFTFTSTIAGSTFKCKLDGRSWLACASPKSYSKLTQGTHTFRVKAKKGTKVDQTPAVRTFTVDTVAPNTTITAGPSGTILDIAPEFRFTSSEQGSTFECGIDAPPWNGQWVACASPWMASSLYYHQAYNVLVRARDAAGNVDATPAKRAFWIDAINLGGGPYAQAAAELYFPESIDLDVPALCGLGGTDCPGDEAPLPASSQLRVQTSDLSVAYATGTNRWDVSATIGVQSLSSFSVQTIAGDCPVTLNSGLGSSPDWTATVSLQFLYASNGDVQITAGTGTIIGIENGDWQVSGPLICQIGSLFSASAVQSVMAATLQAYWQSVGVPLCEKSPPTLVGPCPSWP